MNYASYLYVDSIWIFFVHLATHWCCSSHLISLLKRKNGEKGPHFELSLSWKFHIFPQRYLSKLSHMCTEWLKVFVSHPYAYTLSRSPNYGHTGQIFSCRCSLLLFVCYLFVFICSRCTGSILHGSLSTSFIVARDITWDYEKGTKCAEAFYYK